MGDNTMEKQSDDSREKELLKSLEDLVESEDTDKRYAGSFLGFCARLLSLKPRADADFKLSLEQELLEKHPAHIAKEVDAPVPNIFSSLGNRLRELASTARGELLTMRPLKRLAFGSVPALAIVLALIIAIGNPQVDIARAMEILDSDPHISAVIEAYGLEVQHVKVKGNIGYILLDRDPNVDDVEITIAVDMGNGTVWKIVVQERKILSKSEISGYLDEREADLSKKKKGFAVKAERLGMTLEEYTTHLKKEDYAKFEKGAAARGMTPEEYKTYLAEEKTDKAESYLAEFSAKAESMGMTPAELKAYLAEENAAKVNVYSPEDIAAFEAKAESSGMTLEEYKAYLVEEWASKEKGF
jgi:hypothetical protein